ncbi:hypothetical protein [Nonomuraea gerenzanensis]|uniref:Uncharacterized protein n=1 Tax=Nonomuraea gerenzanensis TaxID=93944 RepID=A0A1M4DZN6_9ACTN|nr:hypothetical protein [Nonomuraea gerenzanensis]UBU14312.1 hypothetical protein LCN96_04595 [Nonomuraea gerenzanensis]SBO92014.1 hypothetical protein BN4615_P1528 [Nonomuraea gerenzanensis]
MAELGFVAERRRDVGTAAELHERGLDVARADGEVRERAGAPLPPAERFHVDRSSAAIAGEIRRWGRR